MPIIGVIASSAKGAPAAPIIGTATNVGTGRAFNNGAATVTFTPGAGATATSFTATSSPGGFTATGASSPLTVTGLQSGVSYTFTVTATNAAGTSPASAASNSITATTVPQAPTIGTATDGGTGTTVSVAFTAGATGGSAITGFTATSSPGSITGTGASSPITVSGLTTGTAYTFTVTATNANGTSLASAASNSVTPAVPTSYESIATLVGNGTANQLTFSNIPQTYKHLQLRMVARDLVTTDNDLKALYLVFNTDTTTSYWFGGYANVNGSGSGGATTTSLLSIGNAIRSNGSATGAVGVSIVDIVDYTDTAKFKTIKSFSGGAPGNDNNPSAIRNSGGYWKSTNAITSIIISNQSGQPFTTTSVFALYGIRG